MKIRAKFNAKNLSLFLGLLGFALLFIIFSFTCCTLGEQEYSLYSLFFIIDDYSLFPMGGLIFFTVFIINFLLYLSLLIFRLLKKDTAKTLYLGIVGIVINIVNIIASFALIFSFASINDLILTFIVFELIGFFVVYTAWIYACKKHDAEEKGLSSVKAKAYIIFSLIELLFFMIPLVIFIIFMGFILLTAGRMSDNNNVKSCKSTTQFKLNKKDNTVTFGNEKYFVKHNKLFDTKTNKEVGYLDKDKVIFEIKKD